MEEQIRKDSSILTCFLAVLKMYDVNIVNYKEIQRHLNKYKHIPKFEQDFGRVTLNLLPIFNVFEKFKYVEKKVNQLDTYYITMTKEQARTILVAVKKKNEPISLDILDSFAKLFIDEDKYFQEMFPKKEIKRTKQITTAKMFLITFCAILQNQEKPIFIFDEGAFEHAFGFNLGNDDIFYQFLGQIFQRKFIKEDLAEVFAKLIHEGFFKFREGLNEKLDMVSFFFRMDAKWARELLETLEEKDASIMEILVNEYLGRNKQKQNERIA